MKAYGNGYGYAFFKKLITAFTSAIWGDGGSGNWGDGGAGNWNDNG
jgi:hypothetical protein